jgi:hypothetical protein
VPDALRRSLLFRLSYHGLSKESGRDLVRGVGVSPLEPPLARFQEVYASPRWLARVYRRV